MADTSGVGGSSGTGSSGQSSGTDNSSSDNDSSSTSDATSTESMASEPTTSESLSGVGSHDAAQASAHQGGSNDNESTTTDTLAASPTTTDSLAGTDSSSMSASGIGSLDAAQGSARSRATQDTAALTDDAIGLSTNVAAGLTSADINLNGLSVANTQVVDSPKFGRFAPNSVTPNQGFSLSKFTSPTRGTAYFSMNTMVSSQASWQNARAIDPTLANTRFEVPSPNTSVNRQYDRAFGNTLFEDKAGKSINARQLDVDIDLARTGQSVNYTFSGNPITGNHGPEAKVADALNDANVRTGGNLTTTVSDVAVSPRTVSAVKGASYTSTALRGASRVAGPIAAAVDVYNIGSTAREHGLASTETAAVVTETAGAWAGAAGGGVAGAKGGAVVGAMVGGPAGAAVGAVVGGVGGAVGGAIAGSSIGKTISGWLGW